MGTEKESQIYRVLSMYERLKNGRELVKKEEAIRFNTSEKSIQRDISSIKNFLAMENATESVDYDRSKKVYTLTTKSPKWLRNEDIFALLKVLIESRAFPKPEMYHLIDALTSLARKEDQESIQQMMANEKHLYVELQHKKELIDLLWTISLAIQNKQFVYMDYKREFDNEAKRRLLKPVGLMFSEYYFYLTAYLADDTKDYPAVYRVDRIEKFEPISAQFKETYESRFQEGEFRKRVQFMYPGELMTVKFKFTGPSIQAVLDRLPTAKIIERFDGGVVFEAEVYGKGIQMWLMSQGKDIVVIGPPQLVEVIKNNADKVQDFYNQLAANNVEFQN